MLKQDRDSERGWFPGIEGTGCLRVDADNVEISESGAGSTEAAGRVRVGREEWGTAGAWAPRGYFRLEPVG